MRTRIRLLVCAIACATACGAAAPSFAAATGFSADADPVAAGAAAARQAVERLRARGATPAAIVYHERCGQRPAAEAARIGAAVKAAAGGVSTYGDGGDIGTWGPCWGVARDRAPGFLALALGGDGLSVRAAAVAGSITNATPGEAVRAAARELAGRLPAPPVDGFVLLLGGVSYDHWTAWTSAFHGARPDLPVIHGMGRPGDGMFLDGAAIDPARPELATGQIALLVRGRLRVALSGACSRNQHDHAALRAEAEDVGRDLVARLGGAPELLIAYSDVTRLRWSRLMDPSAEPAWLRGAVSDAGGDAGRGDAALFGGYCVSATGTDAAGRFSTGEYRLMAAAIRGMP